MAKHVKSPEWAAEDVTDLIAKASFFLFRDKKFRLSFDNFDQMDQIEQDRIFNEIVVSGLVLAILMYETIGELAQNDEKRNYFVELKTEMESRYGNNLRELGVEEEFAGLWKGLIQMRADVYRKDYKKYKIDIGDRLSVNPWTIVVSIGGTDHVSRGKAKPESELFKIFRGWIFNLSEKILIQTQK